MDLFEKLDGKLKNHLPNDGVVNYYGPILSDKQVAYYYENMLEKIAWKHDEAIIFNKPLTNDNYIVSQKTTTKLVTTKRKVAWYADKPFEYTYSNVTKKALPWTEELLELKCLVEEKSGHIYNACLLNLYHDGSEGMAWHSDAEKNLKPEAAITCLSLGAERKFSLKHKKTKESVSLFLQAGSLLIMLGKTQQYWLHRLPTTKTVVSPRISLTFRSIVTNDA